MTEQQQTRVAAFQALLAVPDPFDVWRRHRQTQPGHPDRFALLSVQLPVYRTHVQVDRENACLQ